MGPWDKKHYHLKTKQRKSGAGNKPDKFNKGTEHLKEDAQLKKTAIKLSKDYSPGGSTDNGVPVDKAQVKPLKEYSLKKTRGNTAKDFPLTKIRSKPTKGYSPRKEQAREEKGFLPAGGMMLPHDPPAPVIPPAPLIKAQNIPPKFIAFRISGSQQTAMNKLIFWYMPNTLPFSTLTFLDDGWLEKWELRRLSFDPLIYDYSYREYIYRKLKGWNMASMMKYRQHLSLADEMNFAPSDLPGYITVSELNENDDTYNRYNYYLEQANTIGKLKTNLLQKITADLSLGQTDKSDLSIIFGIIGDGFRSGIQQVSIPSVKGRPGNVIPVNLVTRFYQEYRKSSIFNFKLIGM